MFEFGASTVGRKGRGFSRQLQLLARKGRDFVEERISRVSEKEEREEPVVVEGAK